MTEPLLLGIKQAAPIAGVGRDQMYRLVAEGRVRVDQQLGEGSALRLAPELADPVGPLEVGQHQDVEQLGAGSGAERVEALAELPLDVLQVHEGEASTHCGSSTSADGDRPLSADRGTGNP